MKKIAIFVEGQTELVFVREYLLKMFEYQKIAIECYTLFVDAKHIPTEYSYPCEDATHYFQIMNVGNDNAVLARILKREVYLYEQGFDTIVGLRDMYSQAYRSVNPTPNVIHDGTNQAFIDATQEEIKKRATQSDRILFQYAIMEAEAWILALDSCFLKIDPRLSTGYIEERLGYDLAALNPEAVFFHPANEVKKIYELVNKSYDKSKSDIHQIMSTVDKNEFTALAEGQKCNTFKDFHTALGFE